MIAAGFDRFDRGDRGARTSLGLAESDIEDEDFDLDDEDFDVPSFLK